MSVGFAPYLRVSLYVLDPCVHLMDIYVQDFLISIKLLVLHRAKMVGRGELAMKFDLKMLRALGLILMEHLKGKLEDLSLVPDLPQPSLFMDGCNLLKSELEGIMSIEELKACIIDDSQKKWAKSVVETER
ncbi:hypothetical protein HS088_TW14G00379 [Tripterygium wilfordii]|uniref:Uncharacterized protein n=1 Tax=Tripterygium wilfordii TaxID=458696 RepID=A0A7J7CQ54_TRIWF|nr:hypothetical protein HS088_TW14G00379 [Tripterygium wilfordii]